MPPGSAALAPAQSRPSASTVFAPELGNRRARVRVVIFEDLECPDCAHWHGLMKQAFFPRYLHNVRFEFRDFPLPQHPWAFNAAVLARFFASRDARLYFAWRDYCFTHQNEITPENLMDHAASFAAAAGVSRDALRQAFSRTDLLAAVQRDQAEGGRIPVQHTPTVLVGANRAGQDRDGALAADGLVEATTPQQLSLLLHQALTR